MNGVKEVKNDMRTGRRGEIQNKRGEEKEEKGRRKGRERGGDGRSQAGRLKHSSPWLFIHAWGSHEQMVFIHETTPYR